MGRVRVTLVNQYRTLPGEDRPLTYSVGDDARREVVALAKKARMVGVDIETDGLAEESYTVKVIIIADKYHACVLDAFNPDHVAAARDALAAADILVFHNSPFDVPPLYHAGAMTLDDVDKVVDTLIWANMAFTDSFGGRGLADLERKVLGISAEEAQKDRFKQWCKINGYTISQGFKAVRYEDRAYAMYSGYDGIVTVRLPGPLMGLVIQQLTNHPFGRYGADNAQADALLIEPQIVNRVMLRRSCKGLAIDPPKLQAEQDRLIGVLSDLESSLRVHGVDRPTNPGDLIGALQEAKALPSDYPWTKGGQNTAPRPSTAGVNLEKLDHPAALAFMQYADNKRLLNYLESARAIAERTDGRLHPIVGVMKAVTGRMSYGAPALQQFIEAAREMILFDNEDGVSIDWSQIEPVLLANLAGDTEPLAVYEHSGDLYAGIADLAGVSRKAAKIGLLSTMYGAGVDKVATSLGITIEDAEAVQAKIAGAMPRSWRLIGWSAEWSRVTGCTWTLAGRIANVQPRFAYKGTNYLIQGGGYDLLSHTIVEGHKRGLDDTFYLAFHDEAIVSKSAAPEWAEIMRTPPPRLVELCGRQPVLRVDSADLGERWRTGHPCDVCGSEKALRWTGDVWRCDEH